jgi:hypothetical protein
MDFLKINSSLYYTLNRLLRYEIGLLGYETRSADIFKRLGWEPISNLLRKREELMTFKSLKGMTPAYLKR